MSKCTYVLSICVFKNPKTFKLKSFAGSDSATQDNLAGKHLNFFLLTVKTDKSRCPVHLTDRLQKKNHSSGCKEIPLQSQSTRDI